MLRLTSDHFPICTSSPVSVALSTCSPSAAQSYLLGSLGTSSSACVVSLLTVPQILPLSLVHNSSRRLIHLPPRTTT